MGVDSHLSPKNLYNNNHIGTGNLRSTQHRKSHKARKVMPPKLEKVSPLGVLLRGQCLKPPQKFVSSLVSDVYPCVATPQDIEDLQASGYFERILWRSFHPDVSNSHLELLLEVAAYEYAVHGLALCLTLVLKDKLKADQLMLRLLASTLSTSENTYKLEAKTFSFLRCVMIVCPDLLFRNRLYSKWEGAVLLRYASVVKEDAALKDLELIQCFLLFCISCTATDTELGKAITGRVYSAYYRSADNGLVRWLSEMLLFSMKLTSAFSKLQICLRVENITTQVGLVAFAPLKYDVDHDTVIEELQHLPKKVLLKIAQAVGYLGKEEVPTVLASIISCLALGSRLDWETLLGPWSSTEETMFDIFEKNSLVSFSPDPLMAHSYSDGITLFLEIQCARMCALRRKFNHRITSSLSRLEISDPSVPQGIKGSSKYFYRFQKLSDKGCTARVIGGSDQSLAEFYKGIPVALLELQKPNKYGGLSRMAKFGLSSCRVASVVTSDGGLEVQRRSPELDQRVNALVKLPSFPNYLGSCLVPRIFKDQSIAQNHGDKKRELTNVKILTEEVLKSMYDGPITKLQSFSPTHSSAIVAQFLQTYLLKLKEDLTVVVVPSVAAVDLFPLLPNWTDLTFKFDTDNESVHRARARINSNLAQVSILADHLGLSEYDFAGSIQNALMFYHTQIAPKWNHFITSITESSYDGYPFGELTANSYVELKSVSEEKYAEICSLFTDLQKYLYFDKIPEHANIDDLKKLSAALVAKAKLIIVSDDDLDKLSRTADVVITHDITCLPKVDESLQRLIVTGLTAFQFGNVIDGRRAELNEPTVAEKILCTQQIAGFERSCQRVKIPPSSEQANLEEAAFCFQTYRFMRAIGYARSLILIVCGSPFTKLLITELHEELQKSTTRGFELPILQLADEMYPCENMIVSTHGNFTTAHYFQAVESFLNALFFVGAQIIEPFKLYSDKMEIYVNEKYGERIDRESSALKVKDSKHLAHQVASIIKKDSQELNETSQVLE